MRHDTVILPHYFLVEKPIDADTKVSDEYKKTVDRFKDWDKFAMSMYNNLPSYKATGIARVVVIPLSIKFQGGGHANAIVIDRKHKQAVVVEPHGRA